MTVTAETSPSEPSHRVGPAEDNDHAHRESLRAQAVGMLDSVRRLVDLQIGIWLARAKMAVLRIVLFAALALLTVLLVLAAVVWGYAGIYRVLSDVLQLQRAWALLIFAGLHLLLAAILGWMAAAILRGPAPRASAPETSP